jgi:hypothetical protein
VWDIVQCAQLFFLLQHVYTVMSSSDPCNTCNTDTSRGSQQSPRTCSVDRHRAPSGVSICGYGIAVRWTSISERQMDNTARVEFQVESECGMSRSLNSVGGGRFRVTRAQQGVGVKDARIHLEVDKHAGEP